MMMAQLDIWPRCNPACKMQLPSRFQLCSRSALLGYWVRWHVGPQRIVISLTREGEAPLNFGSGEPERVLSFPLFFANTLK
jgi:hypothetical protein